MSQRKGLGGSSSINGMIYVRGHPQDFDNWSIQGASSWSFADVLPYFKKMECCESQQSPWRKNGPIYVKTAEQKNVLHKFFQMQLYNPVILLLKIIMATSKKALGPQK